MKHVFSIATLLVASACATTGATFRSGVGDRFLEHPPYYAGAEPPAAPVVILPVTYQRGPSLPSTYPLTVTPLLTEMNAWLDAQPGGAVRSKPPLFRGTAPDVHFGCEVDPTDDCVERDEAVLGRRGTTMRLAVGRPSAEWIADLRQALDKAGSGYAVVITLETGQYWMRQRGLRGDKRVELGTAHTIALPWLTSLETPVSTLQLTGVLIDREGKAVRIGAEGIMARRTSLAGSALGLQRIISDEDVAQVRTQRREDLEGQPLAWQVALRHLIDALTGVAP